MPCKGKIMLLQHHERLKSVAAKETLKNDPESKQIISQQSSTQSQLASSSTFSASSMLNHSFFKSTLNHGKSEKKEELTTEMTVSELLNDADVHVKK